MVAAAAVPVESRCTSCRIGSGSTLCMFVQSMAG